MTRRTGLTVVGLALALGAAPAGAQECGTYSGTGCAPAGNRVDLAPPTFSTPTRIDNPLFPMSALHSVVLLGREDGRTFRAETTLLPGTGTVTWGGTRVPVLISQYVAFRDGRLVEVALDRYAQADDGSVWYLGEDVVDYNGGHAVSTEGTWLAGREGPPAMIMPAHPAIGGVFRPENVPGIVFEEVTVHAVGQTVAGPHGPVAGAIETEELHLDGSTERKRFAPGYGEFSTGSGANVEALAVAMPADQLPGPLPAALVRLDAGATGVVGSVEAGDWEGAAATARRMRAAWGALRAGAPPLVSARLAAALDRMSAAVRTRRERVALASALDLQESALDLELRHRPAGAVDRDRLELWCQRLRVDARARARRAVRSDALTLGWIRDRIASGLTAEERQSLDVRLVRVEVAAGDGRMAVAADHAARVVALLRAIPRA